MPTLLTNDRWGYESSCFVCEQSNDLGLRIPFQLDDDLVTVSATFHLGTAHSGAPTLVHGGLSLAILDEAQAWACIAVAGKWALTKQTSASFEGAVHIEREHRVWAQVVEDDGRKIATEAAIVDIRGDVAVRSSATFTVVGVVDETQRALGLADKHQGLLER